MHVFRLGRRPSAILQMGLWANSSGADAPTFANPDFPGVNDGPLTIGEITAKVEARGEVPRRCCWSPRPRITIRYGLRWSHGRVRTADQPLPANVRM